MQVQAENRPVVLCSLQIERQALQRAGLAERAELVCCGPGPQRLVEWAERDGVERERVILAGLAGSLRETMAPGDAFIISTVMSPQAGQRSSGLDPAEFFDPHERPRRAVIASSEEVLATPASKRAWAEKTGADLVDLESAVFAKAAGIFGWRWAIVKGVSDGPLTVLPANIEQWINRDGAARVPIVLLSLLRRPWHLSRVMRLRRDSRAAMRHVAEIVQRLLETRSDA